MYCYTVYIKYIYFGSTFNTLRYTKTLFRSHHSEKSSLHSASYKICRICSSFGFSAFIMKLIFFWSYSHQLLFYRCHTTSMQYYPEYYMYLICGFFCECCTVRLYVVYIHVQYRYSGTVLTNLRFLVTADTDGMWWNCSLCWQKLLGVLCI